MTEWIGKWISNKKKARLLLTGVLTVAVIAGIFWYGKKQQRENRTLEIVLIQKALDDTDFWTSVYQGGEMAAGEFNVNLTVLGPENEREIDAQNRMIEEAIAAKPDAVVLCPSSSDQTISYAKKVEEAGILLILADSTMDEDLGVSVVATDNYEAGYKMGRYMRQFVQEDSVIGIVGHVKGSSTAIGREAGFRAGLGEANAQVAEIVFCNSDMDKAYEQTQKLLEKYPEMDMIVGLNEYSAVGAARAVRDQGKSRKIHMAGIDSSTEQIQFLEAELYDALVVQKPFNMGYLAVETAARALRGEKVSKNIDSGSELITKETMYTEENQKLLFPVAE